MLAWGLPQQARSRGKSAKVAQASLIVSDPLDSVHDAIHDDRMSKLEMVRAALLGIVGAAFLAFDFYIVLTTRNDSVNEYATLAVLLAESTLVLGGVALWPDRRWPRVILGGFVLAIVWLAMVKLVGDYFLFASSFLTRLTVALLMFGSFCLPCGTWFVLYRKISARRLSLFRPRANAAGRVQFGIRHLLIFTTCFAVVALAARAVCPVSLQGQFAIGSDVQEYLVFSFLCLFPGFVAGPLALAVMRPSWRAMLLLAWFPVVVLSELLAVDRAVPAWATPASPATITVGEFFQAAMSVAASYTELAVILSIACVLLRIGGLKLDSSAAN